MKGKMFKLTGTGRFGKAPVPKGPRYAVPIPGKARDTIPSHLPRTDTAPLPLPDKLRGK